MIARWDGKCSLCKGRIPTGEDVRYDSEAKTVQHWECHENPKPSQDSYRLADSLGFRHIPWSELRVIEVDKQ